MRDATDAAAFLTNRRTFLAGTAALPLAGVFPAGAAAQQTWPTRNVTMIVPFPPGGLADLAARPVAQALDKVLGHTFVVDNRSGAGGALGAGVVAKADADGYTVLVTLNSIVVSPESDRLFNRTPIYEVSQLSPVAQIISDPNVIAVEASSPWKTIQDLVADAKKRPGQITYSSSGNYGAAHLSMEMFARAADIKLQHVPYRGAGPAITGLIGSQVNATSTTVGTIISQIEAGKIRVLAAMSDKRIDNLPNVPTLKEAAIPLSFYVWAGMFVPKATPEAVVTRLRGAMRTVLTDPAVASIFTKAGTKVAFLDAADFTRVVNEDHARLAKVVKDIGKLE